ncbi:MAG: hypothetical protein Fur0022_09500 [Anaerolineales bacterium]
MESTQQGTMLIADITGYTQYLSASELAHAREVLKALLELLISHTKPPLVISRLAGDAVISYGLRGRMLSGQTFVEMIETTYVAFRRAIDLMVMNTTCDCKACQNINGLDLKFFVHFGSFGIDRLGGHDEMVGADVIVLHRLLNNHVTEKTGFRAYTLYSDAAIKALGIEGFCEKLIPHQEAYEHLGVVEVWIQDMHPVWKEKQDSLELDIPSEQVMYQYEIDLPLPVEIVWDYMGQEKYRSMLTAGNLVNIVNRQNGRVAPGSVFRCYHGKDKYTHQTILQWQPFEYYLTESESMIPNTKLRDKIQLIPHEGGTRILVKFGRVTGPKLPAFFANLLFGFMLKSMVPKSSVKLTEEITQTLAEGRLTLPEPAQISDENIHQAAVASLTSV